MKLLEFEIGNNFWILRKSHQKNLFSDNVIHEECLSDTDDIDYND